MKAQKDRLEEDGNRAEEEGEVVRDLQKGEQRPVWIKAVLINDDGVEKVIPLDREGEETWNWMILEEDVEHVPRGVEDAERVRKQDWSLRPPTWVNCPATLPRDPG